MRSLARSTVTIPTAPAGDASATSAQFARVVGACVFLVSRYSRDDEVTVDLTARTIARLQQGCMPVFGDARLRLTVDVAGSPSLETLVPRLMLALSNATPLPDDVSLATVGVVIDAATTADAREERAAPASCDLRIGLALGDADVSVEIAYDALLFDAPIIARLRDAAAAIISAACGSQHQPLDRIPLVDEAERLAMDAWNATAVPRDGDELVHELIIRQALRTPDAIAAEHDGATLSYRELLSRAEALAADLAVRGVGPDVVVGICFERSFDLLAAILGVHLAGGAYLPIDADLPQERVAFMLTDASCQLVLTHTRLITRVRCFQRSTDVLDVSVTDAPPAAPARRQRPAPEQLAYVMYTSGSTGTPKGVQVPHRALANHALWFADFTDMTASDRVLQVASVSFDASMAEVFAPLVVGATIVLAPHDAHRDLLGLANLAAAEGITVMQQVPSALRIVVGTAAFGELSALRYLISGGEPLDGQLASDIVRRLPAVRLGNFYGPTEATVDALAFEVPRTMEDVPAVPIGTPVANSRCRILDEHGAPVPIGMPGELYLGGLGLADGYLNLAERTAFRFIADPWMPGERLYRTGDLARYRTDGAVDCLGRIDTQIKLRGYRIELAEVEAPLHRHPDIRDAAVILREDTPGDPQLVAYVVPRDGAAMTAGGLREMMRATCPAWMVPSAFCFLDVLPVMPSGKLDRRALPAPVATVLDRPGVPELHDPLERSLQAIWEGVLGVRPIGPEDDFFALGGHSLKAIRVLAEIDRVHGVLLRAATLFEAPSIRALAARMRTASPNAPSTVVRVQPTGTRTPLFLAPGGGGELFIFESLARAFGPDQPLYVLDMYVFDEITLPTTSLTLADVAARMLMDIRAVQPHGPYQIAGYSLGGNISIEIASQLRAAGEEVHLLALLDCDGPDYPVPQPVMQRTLTHVLHALALTPLAGLRYLRSRMGNVARKVVPPASSVSLYGDQPDVDLVPAHMIQSLEQALKPVLDAWERYRPQPYDGRTLIVRADIRPVMIGVVDDDPWLGWKPVLRGEVILDRLPCDHFTMFHAVNAPQFVAMFAKYLVEGPVQAGVPALRTTQP